MEVIAKTSAIIEYIICMDPKNYVSELHLIVMNKVLQDFVTAIVLN